MNPVVELLLILLLLIASIVWIALYFFLIEGLLQRLVGSILGVTIGRTQLRERRVNAHTRFYVSGWSLASPGSGCLSDSFVWILGGLLRLIFVGGPVGLFLLIGLYLAYLVVT